MRFRLSRHPRARATVTLAVALLVAPLAAESLKTVAPEEVGLSSERLARINAMMERHIEAGEIPGGVTLVARRGRIAHLAAHGLMDLESQRPMRVDAAFRIASMTKPITGVAIMMLLEEGRLTLADYLPRLGQTVLEFQPGSRWAYSPQAAHDTLGRIVEILSGMPFDQFLQQRLFEPLGMDPISFYATGLLTARMPTVYRVTAGRPPAQSKPEFHIEPGVFHGLWGAHHHGRGVREVRTDAARRRRAERAASAQPPNGRLDGGAAHRRHIAGRAADLQWQFRLERRLWHALLGGSHRRHRRPADDPGLGALDAARVREHGHAGHHRLGGGGGGWAVPRQ